MSGRVSRQCRASRSRFQERHIQAARSLKQWTPDPNAVPEVASLALLVWLADRGQHDHVTVRLDDLPTGGALRGTLEQDWTCRVLADKHGLARRRSKRAVPHTRAVRARLRTSYLSDAARRERVAATVRA